MVQGLTVVAVDVGKCNPKNWNFGWALLEPHGKWQFGRNIDELVSAASRALALGPVALGFDAPLCAFGGRSVAGSDGEIWENA